MNLKQLSEKLGLSQTTVSRALNGYSDVSDATRQRVAEMAEATGWLAHTVRGCISGALKKKLGLPITVEKAAVRGTVYGLQWRDPKS